MTMRLTAYERVTQRLLRNQPKPKPYVYFDGRKIHIGTQSLHNTPAARLYRQFWRIKIRRRMSDWKSANE